MFKNHLKIAWRSLRKQPFFTFLNVFGLAIGLCGTLLISLYSYEELNHDKMFTDADRIYRINADVKFGGLPEQLGEVSEPMAATLKHDFPEVEMTTRFRNNGSVLIRKADVTTSVKELQTTFADSTFFKLFDLELLVGNTQNALTQPKTMVLTKTAAEKHFGIYNALGQQMVLNNSETYTVTGVIDDLPKNSFLRDHTVFLAMVGYEYAQVGHWGSHNYFTFLKMAPSANMDNFQTKLQSMFGRYLIPWVQDYYPGMTEKSFKESGNYLNYSTMPLTDIHLYSDMKTELSPNGSIQNVYILSLIALFLIVLASVNFMNLSTAYSLKRAKEVGVRKTLGSRKKDLVRQFLTESNLICFISLFLAVGLAFIALPFFNDVADKAIAIPYTKPLFWIILLAACLLLGLLSGLYPAFFMSRFVPAKVLKGSGESNVGGSRVRNTLVIFQFAVSILLVVGTLVVYQQLDFIQKKELGFDRDQILVLEDINGLGNKVHALKGEVKKLGKVKNASLSGFLPTPSNRNSSTFFKEGTMAQEDAINMERWFVDFDYLNTIGITLIAGRDFDPKISTDSTATIINEAALKVLNVSAEQAIGLRISDDLEEGEATAAYNKVIGVVKNFHFESLRKDISALSMSIGRFPNALAVKLNTQNLDESLSNIETVWNTISPGQPFNYYFLDDSFNRSYRAEKKLGQIFTIFAALSMIIACLGLFGLAAFNAQKRTKEIGVRKVLGASVNQITYRLTVDFLKLVGISILVALPIGWYAMDQWLQDFSYRISIGWEVFAISAFLAVAIAIVTVSYQSIKAAIVNPVKSLRTE
ncbi:FtsX-like permease family protein [uncultured Croceitalea sp.]|uniref:FtsX-like permease family protein n=1 Tax=uncultured Croceitalea sp. TaxID=1798908 RepID=UPI0033056FFD